LIDDLSLLLIMPAEDKLAKADAAVASAWRGDGASVFDQEDEEYLTPNYWAGEEDRNIERAVAAA